MSRLDCFLCYFCVGLAVKFTHNIGRTSNSGAFLSAAEWILLFPLRVKRSTCERMETKLGWHPCPLQDGVPFVARNVYCNLKYSIAKTIQEAGGGRVSFSDGGKRWNVNTLSAAMVSDVVMGRFLYVCVRPFLHDSFWEDEVFWVWNDDFVLRNVFFVVVVLVPHCAYGRDKIYRVWQWLMKNWP